MLLNACWACCWFFLHCYSLKSEVDKKQGVAVIALVIVMVILGSLSAPVVPKFLHLARDARPALIEGRMNNGCRSVIELGKEVNFTEAGPPAHLM